MREDHKRQGPQFIQRRQCPACALHAPTSPVLASRSEDRRGRHDVSSSLSHSREKRASVTSSSTRAGGRWQGRSRQWRASGAGVPGAAAQRPAHRGIKVKDSRGAGCKGAEPVRCNTVHTVAWHSKFWHPVQAGKHIMEKVPAWWQGTPSLAAAVLSQPGWGATNTPAMPAAAVMGVPAMGGTHQAGAQTRTQKTSPSPPGFPRPAPWAPTTQTPPASRHRMRWGIPPGQPQQPAWSLPALLGHAAHTLAALWWSGLGMGGLGAGG